MCRKIIIFGMAILALNTNIQLLGAECSFDHRTFSYDKLLIFEQEKLIRQLAIQAQDGGLVDTTTPYGPTINLATRYGNAILVKKLLEQQVKPSVVTLKEAIAFHHIEILDLILKVYPDLLNVQDSSGSLLHLACLFNRPALVTYLIKKGLKVNSLNSRNQTPLHIAATKGRREIVKLLCENGANPFLKDDKNHDPMDKAYHRLMQPFKIVHYFLDRSTNYHDYNAILETMWQYIGNFGGKRYIYNFT